MSGPLEVCVYEREAPVYSIDAEGPVLLGRQKGSDEQLYSKTKEDGGWRFVVARLDEDTVSREHALIEPLDTGRVRVTNLSRKSAVRVGNQPELGPGQACELALPAALNLGRKQVRLREAPEPLQTLAEATRPPGEAGPPSIALPTLVQSRYGLDDESVFRWLQEAVEILHSAAGSSDFFAKAARAVVEMAGLDTGRILLLDKGEWRARSLYTPRCKPDDRWRPSQRVLDRVLQDRRTFWHLPAASGASSAADGSWLRLQSVVAAPILSQQREVIGVAYGESFRGAGPGQSISRLEAMLAELVAGVVAVGLARIEQEEKALRASILFGQFFTASLSEQLIAQPDLLEGRDCEVTILFSDIRGFSRVSERLEPSRTVAWVRHVMGVLSDCVLAQGGVLVDYIGDEVMAMWGAPVQQPDHARLACKAALEMLARLPELNERWEEVLGEPMHLGIGLNTGVAHVGNTGSHCKFKYGPLGNTVNLASRVQGATKYFKTSLVVTEATYAQLEPGVHVRRLCKVKAVNIGEPVTLYEVAPPGHPNWGAFRAEYERALEAFERRQYAQAGAVLGPLLLQYPEDGPSHLLLSKALAAHFQPDEVGTAIELPK